MSAGFRAHLQLRLDVVDKTNRWSDHLALHHLGDRRRVLPWILVPQSGGTLMRLQSTQTLSAFRRTRSQATSSLPAHHFFVLIILGLSSQIKIAVEVVKEGSPRDQRYEVHCLLAVDFLC